jgi:hypothetical protein
MAKMERCPICDVAVRPENLVRHLNDIHPRHPDTPGLIEQLKAEPGRIPRKTAGRPIRVPWWQVIAVVVVVLGGIGAYYLVQAGSVAPPLPCISGEGGQLYHWHTQLNIFSGATKIVIPGGIGISAFCLEPVHTHQADGLIHIESDVNRLYSIGDFFRVWGKPFGSPTSMLVNGTTPISPPSSTVILYNQESIELHYDSFS